MTRRRYDFMDVKPRLVEVLFWAAVIVLLLLAVVIFSVECGGMR